MDLSPSTWRALGLGVATTYLSLGTYALTLPFSAANVFGLYPSSPAGGPKAEGISTTRVSAIDTAMRLLGARDLSIGLAIGVLSYEGRLREAGVVVLSGVVLCVVDVMEIVRLRGMRIGMGFAVGAGIWMGLGVGLYQC
jgi:hypothetical protein